MFDPNTPTPAKPPSGSTTISCLQALLHNSPPPRAKINEFIRLVLLLPTSLILAASFSLFSGLVTALDNLSTQGTVSGESVRTTMVTNLIVGAFVFTAFLLGKFLFNDSLETTDIFKSYAEHPRFGLAFRLPYNLFKASTLAVLGAFFLIKSTPISPYGEILPLEKNLETVPWAFAAALIAGLSLIDYFKYQQHKKPVDFTNLNHASVVFAEAIGLFTVNLIIAAATGQSLAKASADSSTFFFVLALLKIVEAWDLVVRALLKIIEVLSPVACAFKSTTDGTSRAAVRPLDDENRLVMDMPREPATPSSITSFFDWLGNNAAHLCCRRPQQRRDSLYTKLMEDADAGLPAAPTAQDSVDNRGTETPAGP
jgi:hypothetical protein